MSCRVPWCLDQAVHDKNEVDWVINVGIWRLSMSASVQELATAVSMRMDLTILILNDDAYGMIKWKQVTFSACVLYWASVNCQCLLEIVGLL